MHDRSHTHCRCAAVRWRNHPANAFFSTVPSLETISFPPPSFLTNLPQRLLADFAILPILLAEENANSADFFEGWNWKVGFALLN